MLRIPDNGILLTVDTTNNCLRLTPRRLKISRRQELRVRFIPDPANAVVVTLRLGSPVAAELFENAPPVVHLAADPNDPRFAGITPSPLSSLELKIRDDVAGIVNLALDCVPANRCGSGDFPDIIIQP